VWRINQYTKLVATALVITCILWAADAVLNNGRLATMPMDEIAVSAVGLRPA
jgi:hypothetical protein